MRKIDWLAALLIIAVGVICLAASATSYGGMMSMGHSRGMGGMMNTHGHGFWIAAALLLAVVGGVLVWLWRKR